MVSSLLIPGFGAPLRRRHFCIRDGIAKLAGLAPIARDSGQHSGKRRVRGGREPVRSILFVIAEVVRRYDPDFVAFHQRLSRAGKPNKLIRIAIARKILVRLNAKAREVRNNTALPA